MEKENLGKDYVQIHGKVIGPGSTCSYADLAMGEIDAKSINVKDKTTTHFKILVIFHCHLVLYKFL